MPPVVSTSIMPMTATQGTAACLMTVNTAETEKKLGMVGTLAQTFGA